jgi:deoxyguanosine kinase
MVSEGIRSVAIEGVIGVGKTSLANVLVEDWNARLVLEEPHKNPFLEDFYQNKAAFGFQVQLNFLFARYNQLIRLRQMNLFDQLLVTDYLFEKDKIFAYMNLDEREIVLYEKIIQFMEKDVHRPDMVVYLQSNLERLMQNIRIRNRSYEREMDPGYIKRLIESYNKYFLSYKQSPLLIVNANEIDFVNNPDHRSALVERLEKPVVGTEYFNPNV